MYQSYCTVTTSAPGRYSMSNAYTVWNQDSQVNLLSVPSMSRYNLVQEIS